MNSSHRSTIEPAAGSRKGLYIHIPFCDGKCSYCAFYSVRYVQAAVDRFLDALDCDLHRAFASAGGFQPETVYIGGGTPTVLNTGQLRRLMRMIAPRVPASVIEWTVEANPGTITRAKLQILRNAGVNRISLGIQSTDDAVLMRLGRRHSWQDALRAVSAIRDVGYSNWSADLIACVPGVTIDAWVNTLRHVLDLNPPHVSVYALTVEEGSHLAHAQDFHEVSDARQLHILHETRRILADAGMHQYEISNYARKGFECRHNCGYWQAMEYIGCGPAAATRKGLRRFINDQDVAGYSDALMTGKPVPGRLEKLSPVLSATEALIFGLRMNSGIDLNSIIKRFGLADQPIAGHWEKALRQLAGDKMVRFIKGRWILTSRGRDLADAVAVELMD